MSKVTELASVRSPALTTITMELIEADETPAVVIIRWPAKPSVLHPRLFRPLPISLHGSSRLPSYNWHSSDGSGSCNPRLRALLIVLGPLV